jgi:hypothetical protein
VFSNFDLSGTLFAPHQTIKKVFWLLFLKKVTARRVGEYAHFLFAKLFLLGLLSQKKKRLTSFDSKRV